MNVISDIKNYFLLILMGSTILFGAFLTKISVVLVQPDNSELHCFTSGDEYYSWLHDESGLPIINIQYQTPFHSHITMKVLDIRGRLVTHLVNKSHSLGVYDIHWDAGEYSSGIYFLQYILKGDNLPASQRFQIEKIVLLK